MSIPIPEEQHNIEIHSNLKGWQSKPALQNIYLQFYKKIASQLTRKVDGKIVELGSGIGNMKMVVPEVICTDLFKNDWIDQVENAYHLSFENASVSNLILFDVWHHLKYPGNALDEFNKVLKPGGRVIIFDPAMSLLGFVVYGLFHHEPIAYFKKIQWFAGKPDDLLEKEYYAAQGNASRVFYSSKFRSNLDNWTVINKDKDAAISYVLTGGYSKKQLIPNRLFPIMFAVDKFLKLFPFIFATRLLVVLEKK